MTKRLALTTDGKITYCTASEDNIGKGRCNHVAHQKDGESNEDFIKNHQQSNITLSDLRELTVPEIKKMYKKGENVDLIKKLDKKRVIKFLIEQGETDFPELSKSNKQGVKEERAKGGL